MIPFPFSLAFSPVGRCVMIALAIVGLAGWLYHDGASHAHKADAAAAITESADAMHKEQRGVARYDSDGTDKRLRDDRF